MDAWGRNIKKALAVLQSEHCAWWTEAALGMSKSRVKGLDRDPVPLGLMSSLWLTYLRSSRWWPKHLGCYHLHKRCRCNSWLLVLIWTNPDVEDILGMNQRINLHHPNSPFLFDFSLSCFSSPYLSFFQINRQAFKKNTMTKVAKVSMKSASL